MLLDELNITNFGIYKGDHYVDLAPRSGKPIILFGGLNGGGKTTLLDALQLVLYGKHANTSNRGRMSYDDYLRETINHYAMPKQAMLELYFWHFNEGKKDKYQVKRAWSVKGKSVKEELYISVNGAEDQLLTKHWDEKVNEFIPANISGLFFFDGEKIEGLADARKSAGIIKTGIHALLGLDMVDNLSRDLSALKNRRKIKQQSDEIQAQIAQLKKEKKQILNDCQPLQKQKMEFEVKLDDTQEELNGLWFDFKQRGGELYEEKKSLEADRKTAQGNLEKHEELMRKYAEGAAPLLLVKDLLFKARIQAEREEKGAIATAVVQSLTERDHTLIQQLQAAGAETAILQHATQIMEQDRALREKEIPKEVYLNVPVEAFHGLDNDALDKIAEEGLRLKEQQHTLQAELEQIDRKLSAVPDQGVIASIQTAINEARDETERLTAQIELLNMQIKVREQQADLKDQQISRKLATSTETGFDIERQLKVLEQADAIRDVLVDFRLVLIEQDIAKLERLILESFKSLIRKDDLISKIEINTESYLLELFGKDDQPLKPNRLSAGERQLLAISILWGLAKASGRPLPAIIDTPLGRLDSRHRNQLIENYFPHASHQVILLSTDQEIDQAYCKDLEPYIANKYHIEYKEDLRSSTITEGYF